MQDEWGRGLSKTAVFFFCRQELQGSRRRRIEAFSATKSWRHRRCHHRH